MNKHVRTLGVMGIVMAALALGAAQQPGNKPAQQPPAKPPEMSPEQAMMQDAMPGPVHKEFAKHVGEYTTKTTFSAPDQPKEETTGTAKLSMSLDGRFMVDEATGTMMGMPFKSMKIIGYNNATKQFESVWMYTMSTGMLNMRGTSDDNGKTIKWSGTYKEADGEHTLNVTTTHIDADHFSERLTEGGGDEGAVMETVYTRKK